MKVEYAFDIQLNLEELVPEVKEMFTSINSTLTTFGVTEKLGLAPSTFGTMVATVNREMTGKELEDMRKTIEDQYKGKFPQYNISIASARRKSGNVQQSAS